MPRRDLYTTVRLSLPENLSDTEALQYIRDAVEAWKGGYERDDERKGINLISVRKTVVVAGVKK